MKTKAIVQAMHTGVLVRVQDVVSRMEYPGRVTAIIIRKGKKRKIDVSAEVTDPRGRSVMIVRPEDIVPG